MLEKIVQEPLILSIFTFIIVFLISFNGPPLEVTLITNSIASTFLYTVIFKEEMPRIFRLKYAISLGLAYFISTISLVCLDSRFEKSRGLVFYFGILLLTVIISYVIYLCCDYANRRIGK